MTDRAVPPEVFRATLARFASGVTVVTTVRPTVHAMTASAFTSVSLRPPLVAVCVDETAVLAGIVEVGEPLGISVLAAHQAGLSTWFATPDRPTGAAQLDGVAWTPADELGVPLLDGACATIAGPVTALHPGGDHRIVLVEVRHARAHPTRHPLLYVDGTYRELR